MSTTDPASSNNSSKKSEPTELFAEITKKPRASGEPGSLAPPPSLKVPSDLFSPPVSQAARPSGRPPPPPPSGRALPTLPSASGAPPARSAPPPAPSARAKADSVPRIVGPADSNVAPAAASSTAPPAATAGDVKVEIDDDWDVPGEDAKEKGSDSALSSSESAAKPAVAAAVQKQASSPNIATPIEAVDADEDENTGEIAAAEALADEISDADKTTHFHRSDSDEDDASADRALPRSSPVASPSGMDLKALSSLPTLRSAPPAPPGFGSKPPGQLAAPLPPPPSMPPIKSLTPPSGKTAPPSALLGTSSASVPPPKLPPPPSGRGSLPPVSRPTMPTPDALASSISPMEFQRGSHPPPQAPRSRVVQISALALLVGGLLGLVIVLLVRPNALALGGGSKGSVVVTVSGEGNTPIDQLVILADDVARCETSPCRVTELGAGTHFIRVSAPGYVTTAARAIAVEEGGEGVLHIQLTPAGSAAKSESPSEPQAIAAAADRPSQGAAARAPAPAREQRAHVAERFDPRAKKDDKKAKSTEPVKSGAPGKLNINSIPSTNVVLDGRPVGRTPITGLSVSPGAHTIVFIHPENGRKVQSTTVEPGATRNVGVRF